MAFDGLDPVKNTYTLVDQGAGAVSSAPTGKHRLVNRDGALFMVDSSGVETAVSVDGEPTINYVLNSDAEISPTLNLTATNVTLTGETGSPLMGAQSFNLTSIASTGTVDWTLDTIDSFIIDAGISMEIKAYVKDNAGAGTTGDWKIGVYNVTDALYEVQQNIVTASDNVIDSLLFVPVAGKTYVVRVERTVSSAGDELLVDRVIITPDSAASVPIATNTTYGLVKDRKVYTTTATSGGANDLYITAAFGGPISSVTSAWFIPYQDVTGDWFLEFNYHIVVPSAANGEFYVNGITTQATGDQAIVVTNLTTSTWARGFVDFNSNIFDIATGSNGTNYAVSGLLRLASKPTWAD